MCIFCVADPMTVLTLWRSKQWPSWGEAMAHIRNTEPSYSDFAFLNNVLYLSREWLKLELDKWSEFVLWKLSVY